MFGFLGGDGGGMGPLGMFFEGGMQIAKNMHAEEMQDDAQAFNETQAYRAMEYNANEAATARAWSERMSNTSHQRGVADLRAAGLNPIIAARQGAVSSGGVSASASPASSGIGSPGSSTGMMSSALHAERLGVDIKNIKADTDLKTADRNLRSVDYNVRLKDQDLRNQQIKTEEANTRAAEQQADILTSDAKGRSLEGDIDETKYGAVMRYINRAMRAITGGSSAYRNTK